MSGTPGYEGDDDEEAAYQLGAAVIDMAERLKPMDEIAPGAAATYAFTIDDTTYYLTMTMTKPQLQRG